MKKYLALLLLLANPMWAASSTPGGSVAVAQDPSGNYQFLQVDSTGALITSGGGSTSLTAYSILGNNTGSTANGTSYALGTGVFSLLSGTSSGTGGLVGTTAPTISAPSITGVATQSGAKIIADSAMGANAINGALMSNTWTGTAGATLTVSGSPATGTYFGVWIANTNAGGGAAIVMPITGMTPSPCNASPPCAGASATRIWPSSGNCSGPSLGRRVVRHHWRSQHPKDRLITGLVAVGLFAS